MTGRWNQRSFLFVFKWIVVARATLRLDRWVPGISSPSVDCTPSLLELNRAMLCAMPSYRGIRGRVYMVGTDTSGGGESMNLGAEPSEGEDTGQRGRRERGTMLAHVT